MSVRTIRWILDTSPRMPVLWNLVFPWLLPLFCLMDSIHHLHYTSETEQSPFFLCTAVCGRLRKKQKLKRCTSYDHTAKGKPLHEKSELRSSVSWSKFKASLGYWGWKREGEGKEAGRDDRKARSHLSRNSYGGTSKYCQCETQIQLPSKMLCSPQTLDPLYFATVRALALQQ